MGDRLVPRAPRRWRRDRRGRAVGAPPCGGRGALAIRPSLSWPGCPSRSKLGALGLAADKPISRRRGRTFQG